MKSHLTDLSFYVRYLQEKKMLADSSIRVYKEAVERFLKTNPEIDSLETYNTFIINHSIKQRCYHYYAALKHFIEFKIQDSQTKNKILEGLIRPPLAKDIKQERKYLSEEEILDVINNIVEPKHRVIALIQTLTGVRAGDVIRLKRDNIMPEEYKGKPVLRINITGKGSKRNVVYIHDEIPQHIIMEYISLVYNHNDFYFVEVGKMKNRRGHIHDDDRMQKINYCWYLDDLKQALRVVGIERKDFATHDFRRCYARRCWTRWKDVHVLQGLLNHARVETSIRYLSQSGMANIDYHRDMQMDDEKESK